jgi:hypothetical protein
MNIRETAPWIGWLVAGIMVAFVAMNRGGVAAPVAPSASPAPAASLPMIQSSSVAPLPPPAVDPSIQAALAALAIHGSEATPDPAPVARALSRLQPAPAPAPLPSPTPAAGPIDSEAAQVASLVPAFEQMAADADGLSKGQAEYAKSCVGSSTVPFRDVYGAQVQGTLDKANLPECVELKARMTDMKSALERRSVEIQEKARRAGVLPGVLRRLTEKYGLQLYLKP